MAVGAIAPRKDLKKVEKEIAGRTGHLPADTPLSISFTSGTVADSIGRASYSNPPFFFEITRLRLVTPLEVKAQIRIRRTLDGDWQYLLPDYQDENIDSSWDAELYWGKIWCCEIEIEALTKVDLTADRTATLYISGGEKHDG